MLNLHQKTLAKVKKYLLRQQRQVEEELKVIDKEDPVLNGVPEASEPGTDSWQADVHAKLVSAKDNLAGLLTRIKKSLLRMKEGTYGKCEACNEPIEIERLKAMPSATLCLACSKKKTVK